MFTPSSGKGTPPGAIDTATLLQLYIPPCCASPASEPKGALHALAFVAIRGVVGNDRPIQHVLSPAVSPVIVP